MDILEQYEKESPNMPQERLYENNSVSENIEITQWLIDHSNGLIKNKKQANLLLASVATIMILASLFFILNRNKFSLTPGEKRLFMGKTASEKLLVPQQRDQFLFKK